MAQNTRAIASVQGIETKILQMRGQKVMLDSDLADLYAVQTKVLLQAVKRNTERFPADFMFQLTQQEFVRLRSQNVTSNAAPERGGRRYAPFAFTEQGVAMLSSVLRSSQAIAVNVEIMRTFVRLREMIGSNTELACKLEELESRIDKRLTTHDQAIAGILAAIRELMRTPQPPRRRPIGFVTSDDES